MIFFFFIGAHLFGFIIFQIPIETTRRSVFLEKKTILDEHNVWTAWKKRETHKQELYILTKNNAKKIVLKKKKNT